MPARPTNRRGTSRSKPSAEFLALLDMSQRLAAVEAHTGSIHERLVDHTAADAENFGRIDEKLDDVLNEVRALATAGIVAREVANAEARASARVPAMKWGAGAGAAIGGACYALAVAAGWL